MPLPVNLTDSEPAERRTELLNVTTPNVARMYDYYLGGKDNFAADRRAADEVIAQVPQTRDIARANRAFLGRTVRYLAAKAGIRQFFDIGAGLPTSPNVHEIVQAISPDTRVAYVDNDAVVLIHGRALLATNDAVQIVDGDLRKPRELLANLDLRDLLDFTQPVAVLLVAVLHFLRDADDPYAIVTELMDACVPGSYLVVSHVEHDPALVGATKTYNRASAPAVLRTRDEIIRFFEGLDLVEPPGFVHVQRWYPDPTEALIDFDVPLFGGVAVKP
ncbi:SAM-dependent methyltransferase [Streptosporangiaceae bacterium NEAU-GS5]|nr:SAM-dependent methyltransferase [Streptosporangiaceae bacterium NEAU-GS5]